MTKQTPAQIRLATYRAKAAKYIANNPTSYPSCGHYATWRGWRTKQTETRHYGWDGLGGMWLDSHEFAPGFRATYKAHEVARIGHNGWFTDYYEYDTVFGVVSVLRLGRNAYVIAGHSHSDWDSDFLDFSTVQKIRACEAWDENGRETAVLEDAVRDMAHTADSIAQHFAEKCREDSEKDMAAQRIEQSREEITEARETVRELIREIRAAGAMPPTICATIRRRLTDEWSQIQNLRESVRELTAKPYMIHEYR